MLIPIAFLRTVIAYLYRRVRGGTLTEVSSAYHRTPTALSLTLRGLEERLQMDARLRAEIETLRARCVHGQRPKLKTL